jgi:hypothetical protein
MRVFRIVFSLLVALVKNDVMSLIDSSSFDALFAQCADYHLGVLVSCEVAARTGYTPVEIASIVKNSAASRTAANNVYATDAWRLHVLQLPGARCRIEYAQVDLSPRILIASNDNTWPVHVEKEHCAVGRRFAQDMVLDAEVEVRVGAARDVALQFIRRVGEPLCERRETPPSCKDLGARKVARMGAAKSMRTDALSSVRRADRQH